MVVLQGMFSQAFGQVASKTKETDSIIPIISNDMSIQSTTLDSLGNRYKFYEEVLNETHALLDSLIVIQNKNYLIFDTTISKTYKLIEENKELANSKYLD